mmetsp:Transcript_10080/g.21782  ORF Transcript_10080/g.21782 Transcript_10080/m.21782 type:complete len:449 (+) Transcript_10080:684-2030(+)
MGVPRHDLHQFQLRYNKVLDVHVDQVEASQVTLRKHRQGELGVPEPPLHARVVKVGRRLKVAEAGLVDALVQLQPHHELQRVVLEHLVEDHVVASPQEEYALHGGDVARGVVHEHLVVVRPVHLTAFPVAPDLEHHVTIQRILVHIGVGLPECHLLVIRLNHLEEFVPFGGFKLDLHLWIRLHQHAVEIPLAAPECVELDVIVRAQIGIGAGGPIDFIMFIAVEFEGGDAYTVDDGVFHSSPHLSLVIHVFHVPDHVLHGVDQRVAESTGGIRLVGRQVVRSYEFLHVDALEQLKVSVQVGQILLLFDFFEGGRPAIVEPPELQATAAVMTPITILAQPWPPLLQLETQIKKRPSLGILFHESVIPQQVGVHVGVRVIGPVPARRALIVREVHLLPRVDVPQRHDAHVLAGEGGVAVNVIVRGISVVDEIEDGYHLVLPRAAQHTEVG